MRNRFLMTMWVALALCVGCQSTPRASTDDAQDGSARAEAPQAGEPATLMALSRLEGNRKVDLAKFAGEKPVLLFFGSYT